MNTTRELPFDHGAIAEFVREEIEPHAARFDREEELPRELVRRLGGAGLITMLVPREFGGGGQNYLAFGLLSEELGAACSTTRSLVTVQSMVAAAVLRWGGSAQREQLLPMLATGEVLAAFAATEAEAGSDLMAITTRADREDGEFVLNGRKRWVSFAQIADVFLVLARSEEGLCSFLVDRNAPGLAVHPRAGLLGVRASMLGDVSMTNCRVSSDRLLGGISFGLAGVATTALDLGRYSVAWGCVGIARAALSAALGHARERSQFGVLIGEHQLVRRLLTDIATNVEAARLMCSRAGELKNAGRPESVIATLQAKLFSSTVATRATADAVQIHGARGCSVESSVERLFRDARVMEVIEGSTQVIESLIGEFLLEHGP